MKYTLPIDIGEQALHKTTPEECDAESVQLTHQLESRGAYLADSPPHPTSTTISGRGRKGTGRAGPGRGVGGPRSERARRRCGVDGPRSERRPIEDAAVDRGGGGGDQAAEGL